VCSNIDVVTEFCLKLIANFTFQLVKKTGFSKNE